MDFYTRIWVTTSFQAIHSWRDCDIEKVAFLRNKHRHLFRVKVTCRVYHNDRDVEFFVLQDQVDMICAAWHKKDIGSQSCEMMAHDLMLSLRDQKYDVEEVEVSEDGENGAIVSCKHS
jgi:hypothetical protein